MLRQIVFRLKFLFIVSMTWFVIAGRNVFQVKLESSPVRRVTVRPFQFCFSVIIGPLILTFVLVRLFGKFRVERLKDLLTFEPIVFRIKTFQRNRR